MPMMNKMGKSNPYAQPIQTLGPVGANGAAAGCASVRMFRYYPQGVWFCRLAQVTGGCCCG
jgi:hypothetical protein